MESQKTVQFVKQAEYLRDLLQRRRLTPRELAWRSTLLAHEDASPNAIFSRAAVSSWTCGTRNPRPVHRRALALILDVPLRILNRNCGWELDLAPNGHLSGVTVRVFGKNHHTFEYSLRLAEGVNLLEPAIYRRWSDMFASPPDTLMRHFRASKRKLFGWVPDSVATPLVRQYPCLVPLHTESPNLEWGKPDPRKAWFVYSPDRRIHVGFAYRDHNSLVLLTAGQTTGRSYPLSHIDLIGYVSDRALFQIQPARHKRLSA